MQLSELTRRAMEVRALYAAREKTARGRAWTREELMQGFVVDVGALMKLVMAKSGVRHVPGADRKLAHELSDCLWSVLVLAQVYDVDLEKEFTKTMNALERRLAGRTRRASGPAPKRNRAHHPSRSRTKG